MKNKKEIKELIMYVIVGGFTTLVNYVIYFILLQFDSGWLIANSVAWLGAVIFAFYTNRKVVFQSKNDVKAQAIQFLSLRLVTLVIENVLLYVFIQLFGWHAYLSKILVSFVTVVSNYGLCKFKIFNDQEAKNG